MTQTWKIRVFNSASKVGHPGQDEAFANIPCPESKMLLPVAVAAIWCTTDAFVVVFLNPWHVKSGFVALGIVHHANTNLLFEDRSFLCLCVHSCVQKWLVILESVLLQINFDMITASDVAFYVTPKFGYLSFRRFLESDYGSYFCSIIFFKFKCRIGNKWNNLVKKGKQKKNQWFKNI